jgi:dihydrofolate reductase
VAKLIYSALTSLDGYLADSDGNFEWAAPDEEVHAFLNRTEASTGTWLLGRRMYGFMTYWETVPTDTGPQVDRDFARAWQSADKIVYSRTLTEVPTARTRLERDFDADAVRALKDSDGPDLSVGGAELAGQALAAGLVDELHLYLNPVVVGGGTAALPSGLRLPLSLLDERRFAGGAVFLRYSCSKP